MTILGTRNNCRGTAEAFGDGDSHDVRTIQLVQPLRERLELLLVVLFSALDEVLIFVLELDAFLGDGREFLSVDWCAREG